MPAIVAAIVILASLMQTDSAPQPPESIVPPLWATASPAGVEWALLAEDAGDEVIVCATRAPAVRLLDTRDGADLLDEPLRTNTGARFAGAAGSTLYLFDRHALYAVGRAAESPGRAWRLRWKLDDARLAVRAERSDPEHFIRLTGAAATARGVLAVRSDGRLGLFAREDGRLLWKAEVPAAQDCTILTRGAAAVLLLRADGTLSAHRFVVADEMPPMTFTDLGDSRPLMSALTSDGLVLVEPRGWMLVAPDGAIRRGEPPIAGVLPLATTVISGAADGARSCIISLSDDSTLSCVDIASDAHIGHTRLAQSDGGWLSLEVTGKRVLAIGRSRLALARLDPLAGVRECLVPRGSRIVSAHENAGKLYAVVRSSETDGELRLVCCDHAAAQGRASAGSCEMVEIARLGAADALRDVLWTNRGVLLVEIDRIRAYTLGR